MITVPAYNVQLLAAQLVAKHGTIPGMTARIERAAEIVRAGDVYANSNKALCVLSQTRDDGIGYIVTPTGCTCADYANGAPVIGRAKQCKHRIAVALWKKYIVDAIQPRILPGTDDSPNRKQMRLYPNIWLCRDADSRHLLSSFGVLCRVRLSDAFGGWSPAGDGDFIAVAEWLDRFAQPIPRPVVVEPSAEDAALLPFGDWQSLYSHLYADLRVQ